MVLTAPSGVISDHNGGGSHAIGANCEWIISVSSNYTQIRLHFETFDLEFGSAGPLPSPSGTHSN